MIVLRKMAGEEEGSDRKKRDGKGERNEECVGTGQREGGRGRGKRQVRDMKILEIRLTKIEDVRSNTRSGERDTTF